MERGCPGQEVQQLQTEVHHIHKKGWWPPSFETIPPSLSSNLITYCSSFVCLLLFFLLVCCGPSASLQSLWYVSIYIYIYIFIYNILPPPKLFREHRHFFSFCILRLPPSVFSHLCSLQTTIPLILCDR